MQQIYGFVEELRVEYGLNLSQAEVLSIVCSVVPSGKNRNHLFRLKQ